MKTQLRVPKSARVCPCLLLEARLNTLQLISLETWRFFHPGRSHLAGRSLWAPMQGLGLAQGWRNLMGFVSVDSVLRLTLCRPSGDKEESPNNHLGHPGTDNLKGMRDVSIHLRRVEGEGWLSVLTGLAWSLFFTSCPAACTKVKTSKQQTDTSTHFLAFNTCPGDCDLLWARFMTLQRPLEVGERRAGSRMWREDHTWRRLVVTSDLTHLKP